MLHRIILLWFTCFSCFPLVGAPLYGKIYAQGSTQGTPLFLFKAWDEKSPGRVLRKSEFTTPDGTVVVSEEVLIEQDKFKHYYVNQIQLNEWYKVENKDNDLGFTKQKMGTETIAHEPFTENFVTGPTLIDYISKHWENLTKGETLNIRFAVGERMETVGFTLSRVEPESTEKLTVRMRPASLLVRMAVGPVLVKRDLKSRELSEIIGRTLPKQLVNGKLKDLDGDILYSRIP